MTEDDLFTNVYVGELGWAVGIAINRGGRGHRGEMISDRAGGTGTYN